MTYHRTQGDTGAPIEDELTDNNRESIDITGATVTVEIEKPDGTLVVSDNDTGNAEITGTEPAEVKYDFQTGDLDQPGSYYYEWEVEFSDGTTITWPGAGSGEKIEVREGINS